MQLFLPVLPFTTHVFVIQAVDRGISCRESPQMFDVDALCDIADLNVADGKVSSFSEGMTDLNYTIEGSAFIPPASLVGTK